MKKDDTLDNDLVTTTAAKAIMGVSSRNSVEHFIKKGRIRFIWINEGQTSALRLLLKSDVEAL